MSISENKKTYWSAIALLFFLSFFCRLAAFQQSIYATGWDAYFYLIQIKSWVEEGAMHSSDSSLIYPFMRLVCWLSGDYEIGFKITSAILASSFVALVFIWAKKKTSFGLAILVGSYFLWSPHLTWFASQYPKNLLGLNLMILFFITLKKDWKWIPIFLLGLNYFGHRMTFVLSGIYFAIFFIEKIYSENTFFQKITKHWEKWSIGIFSLITLVFVFQYFSSGTLQFSDLKRFDGMLSAEAHFSPFTFFQEFNSQSRLSVFWKMELGLSVLFYFVGVLLLFLRKNKIKNRGEVLAFFIICSLLVFPFLKWSLTSMSFRFVVVFVLMSPLFLLFNLPWKNERVFIVMFFGFMLASFVSWKSYNPNLHDAPYQKYDRVTQSTFEFLENKNPELVIAHNALAEYFTFTKGIDALPWEPEYEIEDDRLWRIATDVRLAVFRTYLSEEEFEKIKRIGVNYFVIKESVWQQFKSDLLKNEEKVILEKINTWRNPHRIRPAFLLDKKK